MLTFRFVIFCQKEIGKKAARKLLMKLTTCRRRMMMKNYFRSDFHRINFARSFVCISFHLEKFAKAMDDDKTDALFPHLLLCKVVAAVVIRETALRGCT